jgi:hypothetical protein
MFVKGSEIQQTPAVLSWTELIGGFDGIHDVTLGHMRYSKNVTLGHTF